MVGFKTALRLQHLQELFLIDAASDSANDHAIAAVIITMEDAAHAFNHDPIQLRNIERLPSDLIGNLNIGFPSMLSDIRRNRHSAGYTDENERRFPKQIVKHLIDRAFDKEIVNGHQRYKRDAQGLAQFSKGTHTRHHIAFGNIKAQKAIG